MDAHSLTFQEHFSVTAAKATLKIEGIPRNRGERGADYRLSHLVYQSIEEVVN